MYGRLILNFRDMSRFYEVCPVSRRLVQKSKIVPVSYTQKGIRNCPIDLELGDVNENINCCTVENVH